MDDFQNLLKALNQTPKILFEFIRSIPKDKLDLRRGEGIWTVAEHVHHLAQVQPMLLERFERFVNEDHPEFLPYIPNTAKEEIDSPIRINVFATLDQFAWQREKQLLLLRSADDILWKKTATHPEYESYSLYILTRHVLMHDYWHMYRIEELWLTKDAYLTCLE